MRTVEKITVQPMIRLAIINSTDVTVICNCCYNAVAESFFNSLKNELVHHRSFKFRDEVRDAPCFACSLHSLLLVAQKIVPIPNTSIGPL